MRQSHKQGFSLVEVVLALGIVAFGLVVIVALIPTSLHSSRQASEDMALSLIIQTTIADLHKQGLTTLTTDAVNGTTLPYYYDANGRMLPTATGAAYDCTATPIQPKDVASNPVQSTNYVYVQLQFYWPHAAPVANRQSKVVITSVGNYD